MDNNKVAEYDQTGREIWSVTVPSPWSAVRLKNGNTLVTSGRGFVREYDPSGAIVWELTQKDVPDIKLFSLQEADRLANGNTVISNWCPNGIKAPKDWPDFRAGARGDTGQEGRLGFASAHLGRARRIWGRQR